MASIKKLKREVNSLCENLHNECFVELVFGTSNEIERVWSIMVRCEKLKLDTLKKVNSKLPKKMTIKERKEYYKETNVVFYDATMKLIDDLNHIIP